jgi:hypothetical protein
MQFRAFPLLILKVVLTPFAMALLLAKRSEAMGSVSKVKTTALAKTAVAHVMGNHQPLSRSDIPSLESALGLWMHRDDPTATRIESADHLRVVTDIEAVREIVATPGSQPSLLAIDASTPK